MKPVETVRLSQQARDQLVKLKRVTGLKQWNVLCRWAFCTSLNEPSLPKKAKIVLDSNVEMTWKVFGGEYELLYEAFLKQRCEQDGLGTDDETLAEQFRLHMHRGIGYLAADKNLTSIAKLIEKVPLTGNSNGRKQNSKA